ncbi:hypothetical protein BZA77DRAFT_390662 [Pyronema omphalodes]|nr:hypothetical protein BZA77DRAFT_390662 [Pyronema omphalodes]
MGSIQPLPSDTIRALGSSQTLTDPVSLIKELIENSLDANATQITIETSANLIDFIQVKDNGFGISPTDRPLAFKRNCTSKISSFSDLNELTTLGFRGEALASAAELAEKTNFTTRCEGEPVAEIYNVSRDGSISGKRPIGAPLGTTIRVEGILKRLPVRRENALRNTQGLIKRLRSLVATYYLSRPKCRFGLKIKGQKDTVYPPSKSVPEAVMKVVGKEASNQCEWFETERYGIKVEAFIAKSFADAAALHKEWCAPYIYVDGRPVAANKRQTTITVIWKMYRAYVKAYSTADESKITNPLLYLHLKCPGMYDANVEPAKDDVLFDNSKELKIITLVEDLFKSVYGDLPYAAKEHSKRQKAREQNPTQSDDFNVLLARRKEPSPGEENQELLSDIALLSPPLPPMRMPDSDPASPLDVTTGQHNDKSPIDTRGNVVQHDTQAVQDPVNKDSTNPNHVITPVLDISSNRQITSNILSSPCDSYERPPPSAQHPTTNSDVDMQDSPVSAARSSPLRLQNALIYPSPTAAVTPNNPSPCFNPINQSRGSRTSEGSSPLQPHAPAVRRKRFGPPQGISSPNQQPPSSPYTPPRLLEDPENAGAIERFLIRRPRSPDPAARPLQLDVTPDSIRRPIPHEMDHHAMHSLSPTNHLSGSSLSNHNSSAQMQARQSPSQHTRPHGVEPFMQPLQPFLQPSPYGPTSRLVSSTAPMMGSSTHSQYSQSIPSADISESSGALEAPRKRPRLNNSPHKNRFLNATAELAQDTIMEDSMRRSVPQPLPPSILRAGDELTEPREPMALREPRVSGVSAQGGSSAIQQELPPAPKPHPQRRKSTRTQPAPPLLPYDDAWQTHRLVLSMNAATALRKPVRITEDFYDLDENTGTLVERWLDKMLGEALPRARDWDLVERQDDVATLRAIYEGI